MDSEMTTGIEYDLHRYPFCLVWTPIPLITWLLPFVGHMGIATSQGIIRDFAGKFVALELEITTKIFCFSGPYFVSNDDMGFGWPTRYLVLDENKVEGGRDAWDDSVAKASVEYGKRMHNLFWDNCHSHCGMALKLMRYDGSTSWNMVRMAAWMFFFGKYVGFWGFVKTWLPFAIIVATIYLICFFTV